MKFKVGDKVRVISLPNCRVSCLDCPYKSKEIVEILNCYSEKLTISVIFNGKKLPACSYINEENLQLVILTQSQKLGL